MEEIHMKGKLRLFLMASILSVAALTGCGNTSGGEDDDGGGDDGGGGQTPGEIISGLDIQVDEAQNKLKQLGSTQGFEITLEAISQEDDGTTSKESATIGFKVETAWLAGEGAYLMTRDGTETYAYTATSGQYDYVATIDGKYFDNYITTITSMFYIAYSYNSYLDKVGPTIFLGRPATEYKFAGSYATAFANIEIIIDDATGITLKFAGSGQDLDGNAAAGSLVVTAFKTGEDVVRPVLNKNGGSQGGGQGGEGGEGEQTVTLPQAGKYSYDATQVRDPGIYENGYFEIDADGNGIFCEYPNYLGEQHYYTGSFVLDGLDIVMTTTFSVLEPLNGGRKTESATGGSQFTFAFIGDASYAITLDGHRIVYKYDQGQGGGTPVDNLEDALITAEQYASLVTGMAYIGAEGNAKFNVEVKANKDPFYNETLECDNGNYQDGVAYTNDDPIVRIYAGFEGHPGYYYIFERQSDFSWKQTSKDPSQIELIQFASMAGLDLLSYVPFDRLSAPTFVEAPYYSCSSFTYKDDELGINVSLSNIKIYFEEGKLVHFSYVSDGYLFIDVQVTDIGKVKVEIPEIKPEEKEEQHNELLYGTSGAKFVFSSADKGGYTGSDFDALIAAIQNCYFNFFPDGSAELHNTQAIYLGTFTAMKKASENTAAVSVRFTQKYVISNQDLVNETTSEYFTYYVTNDELHLIQKGTQNGNQVEIHIIFTRSNDVPTPFEPSEPQPSKWPTVTITTALQKLGLKANVPEMPGLDNVVGDVDVKTIGETLQITVEYDTKDNAAIAEYQYYSILTEKGAYKVDYANSDFDEGIFAYLSNDNTISIIETYVSGTTTVSIVIKAAEVPSYPEETIDGWLLSHGVTDEIIEFTYENATYDFDEEYGTLMISLPNGAVATNIINGFIEDLTKNYEYKPVTIAEYTAYVGPNGTVGFIFMNYDSMIAVAFSDSSQLPQSSDSYPTSKVEQYLADMKITDSVPEFTCEGATYDFYGEKGEDGVWSETIAVGINLPDDADYELIAKQFVDLLTGYTEEGEYYLSPNKQVCVEIYAIEGFVGITIYPYVPEQEYVDITIIAYDTRTVEGQRVYLVGDFCNWDLTDENAIALEWNDELKAWVGYITAEVGSEIYCKLIITSWDNPGEYITWEKEGFDNERIYDVPDTDTTFTLFWGNY